MNFKDPFQMAQDRFKKMSDVAPEKSIMENQLFGIFPETGKTANAPAQSPSLIESLNSAPSMDFQSSGIPKMLQKAGIDDKGISVNPLGRVQLVSRLKNKFGIDYNKNPDAISIMSKFDEVMKKTPMTSAEDLTRMNSSGERTLQAILGGG